MDELPGRGRHCALGCSFHPPSLSLRKLLPQGEPSTPPNSGLATSLATLRDKRDRCWPGSACCCSVRTNDKEIPRRFPRLRSGQIAPPLASLGAGGITQSWKGAAQWEDRQECLPLVACRYLMAKQGKVFLYRTGREVGCCLDEKQIPRRCACATTLLGMTRSMLSMKRGSQRESGKPFQDKRSHRLLARAARIEEESG